MHHNTSLESENAELRAELAAAHAIVHASAGAAACEQAAQPAPAAAVQQGLGLAPCDVEQHKDTGLRLLELAQHSALIAAAYQVSRASHAVGMSMCLGQTPSHGSSAT